MVKKILVVDDDRDIVKVVQINLEHAGYEVVTAYDGVEALEKVESDRPDMVITDDRMPRMDGFELVKKLQEDDRFRDIPVIMLADGNQDADIFKGWSLGVSGYYTKPFHPIEILVATERIFQSLESLKKPPPPDDSDKF